MIPFSLCIKAVFRDLIRAARPSVLLVEEAGEILESHVLTALSETVEHMILIGDHKCVYISGQRRMLTRRNIIGNYGLRSIITISPWKREQASTSTGVSSRD